MQVRKNAIIMYTYTEYPESHRKNNNTYRWKSNQNLSGEKYTGKLTQGAKKRLVKAIDLLCQMTKPTYMINPATGKRFRHTLTFITLTIPQSEVITAREAYDTCFKHFMQWMRRTLQVKTYVWKVEHQVRGQIHYHITTPTVIHYQNIKDKWNNLISAAGYCKEYFEHNNGKMPNSTDIHAVKHVKNFASYMIKEFAKSIQNPNTTGKVWDCSTNLKAYGYYTATKNGLNSIMLNELLEKEPTRFKKMDFCTIIDTYNLPQTDILSLQQLHNLDKHLQLIRMS